jgi:hypothetical protein
MQNYKPYLLLVIGEILLILTFLHFGHELKQDILVLNITVSSVVYLMLFSSFLFPLINLKDKSQSDIGFIGVNWFFSAGYTFIAIAIMVYFNILNKEAGKFENQLLIHAILFFLLLIGGFLSRKTADKVSEVYQEQKIERNKLEELKKSTKNLVLRVELMHDLSPEFKYNLNRLLEDIRFLSPSNNLDVNQLDEKYIETIRRIEDMLYNKENNKENMDIALKQCAQFLKERKQSYSN